MELLVLIFAIVVALAAFGLAAVRYGVDTRPSLPDDHAWESGAW